MKFLTRKRVQEVVVKCSVCGREKFVQVPSDIFESFKKALELSGGVSVSEKEDKLEFITVCESCRAKEVISDFLKAVIDERIKRLSSDRRYIRYIKYRRIHGLPQI